MMLVGPDEDNRSIGFNEAADIPARFTDLGAGLVQPLFCQRRDVDADDLLELLQSTR
jgi:hypothetical protein